MENEECEAEVFPFFIFHFAFQISARPAASRAARATHHPFPAGHPEIFDRTDAAKVLQLRMRSLSVMFSQLHASSTVLSRSAAIIQHNLAPPPWRAP
jgi:hypothetical protein